MVTNRENYDQHYSSAETYTFYFPGAEYCSGLSGCRGSARNTTREKKK